MSRLRRLRQAFPDPGEDWRTEALCQWVDPELMFAEGWGGIADARYLCRACPVITACLATAMRRERFLTARNRYGVWGGRTPHQRAQIAQVVVPPEDGELAEEELLLGELDTDPVA